MFTNRRGDLCNPLFDRVVDYRRAGGQLAPPCEFRNATELRAVGRLLSGVAAPYEIEARIGNFSEVLKSGCFAQSLSENPDVLALVDHDTTKLLGRSRSGSLRLVETRSGLEFELDVPDTQLGRDTLALATRGDLGGMSFAFRPRVDGERWVGRRRELRSLDLVEVSVVHAWPAYNQTSIQARMSTSRPGGWQRLWLETV